jgi:hypothetical protein
MGIIHIYSLVGGLEHEFYFSIYLECHHPNCYSLIFFRGFNHQPVQMCFSLCFRLDHYVKLWRCHPDVAAAWVVRKVAT